MAQPVRIKGLRETLRAADRAGKDTKREVNKTFRKVGEVIRVPWRGELERFGSKTAGGLRTRVRQRGVSVEQTRRKTSIPARRRPNFGPLQQDIGDQVADREEDRVEDEFDQALDRVAANFDK